MWLSNQWITCGVKSLSSYLLVCTSYQCRSSYLMLEKTQHSFLLLSSCIPDSNHCFEATLLRELLHALSNHYHCRSVRSQKTKHSLSAWLQQLATTLMISKAPWPVNLVARLTIISSYCQLSDTASQKCHKCPEVNKGSSQKNDKGTTTLQYDHHDRGIRSWWLAGSDVQT